ncbi:MAG: cob(I)yrinic acid a,c-diamide adenosyltransferase [Thermodesulfobacteriota bacterium]|nr:cob(I)yrinic acid a,c-diamide adenosyltransferase [Thermodesulfobacteriota bacterium]
MKKGLLIVKTGNGKGETTSAIDQAFRLMERCMIQFIKGS